MHHSPSVLAANVRRVVHICMDRHRVRARHKFNCVCVQMQRNEAIACRPSRVPKACLGPAPQIPSPHTAEDFLAADRHCPGAIDGEREGPRVQEGGLTFDKRP